MSNSVATPTKSPAPKLTRVPPEEQFWKRYSPHGEAPLSVAGSIGLHALGLGVLLLFAFYLASLFVTSTQSLPVEPVRIEAVGGGGGNPRGSGSGKGVGELVDAQGTPDKDISQTGVDEAPARPSLNPVEKAQVQEKYDTASARFLSEANTEPAKAFARLDDKVRSKLSQGLNPGKGKGGTGSGGGSGTGSGDGTGSGTGSGKATLNKREKRMLRWHMRFTANSGDSYLAQLRGLGAILAFPTNDGPDPSYKIVRNLHRGKARLVEEDMSKIHRIYWIDDKPQSVSDVVTALGLNLPGVPSRFVAFMPEKLESELFGMERRYVERVLRQPFNEDRIEETVFRVVPTASGFKPELIKVTMR